MKENKYDDPTFFQKYAGMARSQQGLAGAGEWQAFRALLPDFQGKSVLDLGCGYGWHCKYAQEKGAAQVLGVDLSQKMLRKKSMPPLASPTAAPLWRTWSFPPQAFKRLSAPWLFII